VEADGGDAVLAAELPALVIERLHRSDRAVEDEAAQLRALVVRQDEQDRMHAVEQRSQRGALSAGIDEAEIERQPRAQVLDDVGAWGPRRRARLRRGHGHGGLRRDQQYEREGGHRGTSPAIAGDAAPISLGSATTASIARSIGIRTTPARRSTQS